MLIAHKLCKKFGQRVILDDVSFTVKQGEIAFFLGASGVGKTTLLRVLNNLEKLDSGIVSLHGKQLDLSHINNTHTIGMVFQQFNLFENMTVIENVTFPLEKAAGILPKEARALALHILDQYKLHDKKDFFIQQLSGGQKQRLAIARTVALKPKIICMDEPTSALDPLLTNYVAENIHKLAQEGYMVLVASHDISLIDKLNCRLYLMDKGMIVESVDTVEYRNNANVSPAIHNFIQGHRPIE